MHVIVISIKPATHYREKLMKKILLFSASIMIVALIALFPFKNSVSAATTCCRGKCGNGNWTTWFISSNCKYEIHDRCGNSPYTAQTQAASACPY